MPSAFLIAAILAQTIVPTTEPSADLQRIRASLAAAPAISVPAEPARDGLVFRVTVHAPAPQKPVWDDWSNVPSYIRPNMLLSHYEFLQQATPQDFRAGTLYPVGIPVLALIEMLARNIKIAHYKSQEAHAREEVQQALAELLACRADPARPGC